jgi:hypothetical protein
MNAKEATKKLGRDPRETRLHPLHCQLQETEEAFSFASPESASRDEAY